jgi:hypothetical protein
MKKTILNISALLGLLIPAACSETQFVSADKEGSLNHDLDKTPLSKVSSGDLTGQTTTCRDNKICVEICHRPPGDPENSKTMLLPIAAQLAHLNHGNDANEQDYLGPCDASDEAPIPPVVDNPPVEPPEVLPGDSTEPLPPWCAIIIDIDSNCDGYMDESGEPIF